MSFTDLFYKHIMFRESCSKCHFANTRRPSDITLGDFWGWEKTDPNFNKDDKGVSLVLINTEKGRDLFDKVKDRMIVIPARIEDCLQPNLQHPSNPSPLRENFVKDYEKRGVGYVLSKYRENRVKYIIHKVKRLIKKIYKKQNADK